MGVRLVPKTGDLLRTRSIFQINVKVKEVFIMESDRAGNLALRLFVWRSKLRLVTVLKGDLRQMCHRTVAKDLSAMMKDFTQACVRQMKLNEASFTASNCVTFHWHFRPLGDKYQLCHLTILCDDPEEKVRV